jgi:hypothetical protein
MEKSEQEFYANLGLLSVKFSLMEFNLSFILSKLICNDDNLASMTTIERNSLTLNIELIKKVNKIKFFEPTVIKNLLQQISEVQNVRNLFIHGVWKHPDGIGSEFVMVCRGMRIRYTEDKNDIGEIIGATWDYENHFFSVSDINEQINKVMDILSVQESLICKLKEEFSE